MIEILKTLLEAAKGRSEAQIAKLMAYALVPGLLLGLSAYGLIGSTLTRDIQRPVAISKLKTELARNGVIEEKSGIILIAEPAYSEYRIHLGLGASKIWSSMDKETARGNAENLKIDDGGWLTGKTPFVGVSDPVTVVVEGNLGKDIQVPGGVERSDDWYLYSRRSNSLVSSVLFVWVFALGMSLAMGFPPVNRYEDTAS